MRDEPTGRDGWSGREASSASAAGAGVGRRRAGVTAGPGRRAVALLVMSAVVVVAVLIAGVSLGRTLALPGDVGPMTRLADWGRANHLSFVVNRVDRR